MKTLLLLTSLVTLYGFTTINEKTNPQLNLKSSQEIVDNEFVFDSSFVLHYYHGGGMRYESSDIFIRYDSCVNIHMENGKDYVTKFAMTSQKIDQVIAKLNECNFKKIKQKSTGFANDKPTSKICLTQNKESKWCVFSDAQTEIHEDSKVDFSNLVSFMQTFSVQSKK